MPKATSTYNPSLSRREVDLLSTWEREQRISLTIEDIRDAVGERAARDVASSLVRKHALQRLQRGKYLLRPFRSLLRPTNVSPVTAAAALLAQEPYYLGGLWALSFHRLSTQQFLTVIDVFVVRRRYAVVEIPSSHLAFHVIPLTAMRYGISQAQLEGMQVRVSDLERTLLDLLDHPTLSGSLDRALSTFAESLTAADTKRIVNYAVAGSRSSTCQRLGVHLERLGTSDRLLSPLRKKVRGGKSLLSMLPNERRTGPVNTRWNVVENDT